MHSVKYSATNFWIDSEMQFGKSFCGALVLALQVSHSLAASVLLIHFSRPGVSLIRLGWSEACP